MRSGIFAMNSAQPVPNQPRVGERVQVTVETLATGGDGVARYQGFTLFIPRSAPGDMLDIEITEARATRPIPPRPRPWPAHRPTTGAAAHPGPATQR